jgi:hypothetical protein
MTQRELNLFPKVYCYTFSYCRQTVDEWRCLTGYKHQYTWRDFDFLVSRDGFEWYVMYQVWQQSRNAFLRVVDETVTYYGTVSDVREQLLCTN